MVGFIDDHRKVYGVESICAVLPIAPSTYFWHKAQQVNPARRAARARRDVSVRRRPFLTTRPMATVLIGVSWEGGLPAAADPVAVGLNPLPTDGCR